MTEVIMDESFESFMESKIGNDIHKQSIWKSITDTCEESMGKDSPVTPTFVYGYLYNTIELIIKELIELDEKMMKTIPSEYENKKKKNNNNNNNIYEEIDMNMNETRQESLLHKLISSFKMMKMVISKVPDGVIVRLYDKISQMIIDLIEKEPMMDIIHSCLDISSILLMKQPIFTEQVEKHFNMILNLSLSSKKKIRSISTSSLRSLFLNLSSSKKIQSSSSLNNDKTVLLKNFIKIISKRSEDIFKNVSYNKTLSSQYMIDIFKSIIQFVDYKKQKKWILLSLQLPKIGSTIASQCRFLRNIVINLLQFNIILNEIELIENGNISSKNNTIIYRVINFLEEGLKISFYESWDDILSITSILLRNISKTSILYQYINDSKQLYSRRSTILSFIGNITKSIFDMRKEFIKLNQKKSNELEECLKYSLYSLGIELFFETIGYKFPSHKDDFILNNNNHDLSGKIDYDDINQWIFNFISNHLSFSELNIFYNYFIPLYEHLRDIINDFKDNNNLNHEYKYYEMICNKIWTSFPHFTKNANDIHELFDPIIELLFSYFENNDYSYIFNISNGLHLMISNIKGDIHSIENIVQQYQNHHPLDINKYHQLNNYIIMDHYLIKNHSIIIDDLKKSLEIISSCSIKILPILFNLFITNKNDELNQTIYKCIESFVSISSNDIINNFFGDVLTKVLISTTNFNDNDFSLKKEKKNLSISLIHLSNVFVQYLGYDNINVLFKVIYPELMNKKNNNNQSHDSYDIKLIKKSFKVLKSICQYHTQFIHDNIHLMMDILSDSSFTSNSKMNSIYYLINSLEYDMTMQWFNGSLNNIPSPLPIIASSYRDTSSKTRKASQSVIDLLVEKINVLNLSRFLVLLFAINDSHIQTSTVHIFTYLLKNFKDSFLTNDGLDLANKIIKTILLLFSISNLEIKKSLLDFIKVSIKSVHVDILLLYIKDISHIILSLDSDVKAKLLTEIKVIFERLIKKLGFDKVKEVVPHQHHKFINNIRKTYERSKRKAHQKKNGWKLKDNDVGDNEINEDDEDEKIFIDKEIGKIIIDDVLESDDDDDEESDDDTRKKRKRDDNDEKEIISATEDSWNTKVQLKKTVNKKHDKHEKALQIKESYKSKRAGGDMKKPGRVDPYSYLPLDPKYLNKRRKAQASKQFDSFVGSQKKKQKKK